MCPVILCLQKKASNKFIFIKILHRFQYFIRAFPIFCQKFLEKIHENSEMYLLLISVCPTLDVFSRDLLSMSSDQWPNIVSPLTDLWPSKGREIFAIRYLTVTNHFLQYIITIFSCFTPSFCGLKTY